ncbi:MAG: cation:proton antiporter [Deltaproteobacteria bacterium]|nr:cation:proton antiporter [Deltaproteobacteria bacterium]
MNTISGDITQTVLLVAVVTIITLLVKAWLHRTVVPPLVGFLLLGMLLRWLDDEGTLVSDQSASILRFLGEIGLFTLLFKVGLESNLAGLIAQIRRASLVWLANILGTGLMSYLAAYYIFGQGLLPSLVVGVAFTATSVGVTAQMWEDAGALNTDNGDLLLDVAELDDVSAVVFMALLFAVLPEMRQGKAEGLFWSSVATTGIFALKLIAFVALCVLFSTHGERRLTAYFQRLEKPPEAMLMIAGVALLFAALAGLWGFSLAVGAFMAGLVFSRDPATLKLETSFIPLHDFFSPFFFISIGLAVDPAVFHQALGLGLGLAVVAIVGKVLSNGLAVWGLGSLSAGMVVGASMVPRAEIALIIMHRGQQMGPWAVSTHLYTATVVVTFITCIAAPLTVRYLLRRWPQNGPGRG